MHFALFVVRDGMQAARRGLSSACAELWRRTKATRWDGIATSSRLAIGSSSKNAPFIIDRLGLNDFFEIIVDGSMVSIPKPNPEVFLNGAKAMNLKPENCIVFEDSVAGIQAANAAGMISIGIGNENILSEAMYNFTDFTELSNSFLEELIKH